MTDSFMTFPDTASSIGISNSSFVTRSYWLDETEIL